MKIWAAAICCAVLSGGNLMGFLLMFALCLGAKSLNNHRYNKGRWS